MRTIYVRGKMAPCVTLTFVFIIKMSLLQIYALQFWNPGSRVTVFRCLTPLGDGFAMLGEPQWERSTPTKGGGGSSTHSKYGGIQWCGHTGNPRFLSTFLDESDNLHLANLCRSSHAMVFEAAVLLKAAASIERKVRMRR